MKTFINKTFLAIVATVLIAGTAFFASCEKDEDNSNIAVGESKSSNGENPFDFIGEKHNEILNYMGFELKDHLNELAEKEEISDVDREEFFNHIIEILPDVVAQNSILDISADEINSFMESYFTFLEEEEYETSVINNPDFQILKDILNESCEIVNPIEEAEFIRTKGFELLYSAEKWEDTCILVFLNVYEHSLLYWEDAFINPENPWYNFLQSIDNSKQISSKALPTVKEICAYIKKGVDKVGDWLHGVFRSYTWRNIAEADAIGAGFGALSIGMISGWNSTTTLSGAIITGAVSSLINPLFM